jgi:predicted dehydrogenase
MTRRSFIRNTAASTALFSIVPRHVIGGSGFVPPSEKVNVAIIGTGGMGMRNAKALLHEPDARVAAICDLAAETDLRNYWYRCFAGREPTRKMVEEHYSEESKKSVKCPTYDDFRVMLEKEKGIDAVLCGTPDHTHAFISITCMRAGKHVYCEKPLAHNVWECRRMAEVAKETGVATQMGNHRHSGSGIRMTCEWIQDGVVGDVREVHAWTQSSRWYKGLGRPTETPPVPVGFNWDQWLGPVEDRPYHPAYAPYVWRDWWAFGTGSLGNVGTHYMDPAAWALDLYKPLTAEGSTTGGCDSEVSAWGAIFTFHFGARGNKPPVKAIIDADKPQQRLSNSGVLFVGEKGCLTCTPSDLSPVVLPLDLHKSYKRPAPSIPRTKGHHAEWLTACKGGTPASSNFANSAPLTEMVLLGNVALRTGKKIQWDAENMRATNAPEADKYIRESRRPGWDI